MADGSRASRSAVRRLRRGLSRAARSLRRGRDGPGPARARRDRLRRVRSRSVSPRDGQGSLQGGHARQGNCRSPQRNPQGRPHGTGRESGRAAGGREALPARVELWDHDRPHAGRARYRSRPCIRPRRQGPHRGVRRGNRGRMRCPRERAAGRLGSRRDRTAARRLVRLRLQVRRRWHGARRSRPHLRARSQRTFGSSPLLRSSPPIARVWHESTSSCDRTARCSSTS